MSEQDIWYSETCLDTLDSKERIIRESEDFEVLEEGLRR